MGLLLPHKRTASIYPDMVSFSQPHTGTVQERSKRSEITEFTPAARYRLFRLLHSVKFDRISFITLTYPRTWPDDTRRTKANLKEFRRRFERKWGKVQCIWRLEFQRRGAPHYHILALDAPYIEIRNLELLWVRVRGGLETEEHNNSVDLKINASREDSQKIGYYAAKYIGKPVGEENQISYAHCGRFWGKWNIPEPIPERVELYDWEVRSIVEGELSSKTGNNWIPADTTICTLFGEQMGSGAFGERIKQRIVSETERKGYKPIPKRKVKV